MTSIFRFVLYIDTEYEGNEPEFGYILNFINYIYESSQQTKNFSKNITTFLTNTSKFNEPSFSHYELYIILHENLPIINFFYKNHSS